MYTEGTATQVLPPKILPTIYQNGTTDVQPVTESVPVTQVYQPVQVVQAQPQVSMVPQIVYVPQIVQVPQPVQPPKPLQPSPPYTSYIPPTPVSKSFVDTQPKPVYQFYKLVPITTSYAQVPIEQSAVAPNYSTVSAPIV